MKKIGEIKGIPVVEGNINEVIKNQIHYKETGGGIQLSKRGNDNKLNSVTGSSSGTTSNIKHIPKYYTIEKDIPDEMKGFITQFGSTIKQVYNGQVMINPVIFVNNPSFTLIGFSFNPVYTEVFGAVRYIDSIEDLGAFLEGEEADLLLQSIKRITEEEFYNLD